MEWNLTTIVSLIIILVSAVDIKLMSSPKTALLGNRIGALSMLGAIVFVLLYHGIIGAPLLLASSAVGTVLGIILTRKTTTLRIPQVVALFNGLGGGASLFVSMILVIEKGVVLDPFSRFTAFLGIVVGGLTLSGSLVAAGKLEGIINQRPVLLKGHSFLSLVLIAAMLGLTVAGTLLPDLALVLSLAGALLSLVFGVLFAIRIGGADMPITISLLNSYSGVAASICGFAVGDIILVAIGAIVGASGLILTRIMCIAMNRSLISILTGATSLRRISAAGTGRGVHEETEEEVLRNFYDFMRDARKVVIIPGYGMALAQAQWQVKALFDHLVSQGKEVRFAIHPVAGRMPGHMNVLLAEVDIPYEYLCDIDTINPAFADTDIAIIVGACDVVNPEAMTAEGTPIYGMPILRAHEARHVLVFNMNTRPGYSGVENSLYQRDHVSLLLGNASSTLDKFLNNIRHPELHIRLHRPGKDNTFYNLLHGAKKVVIVPGYGMALAQAQWQVKALFDHLDKQGVDVRFAIHPVAGRMPGHMNVLLAEVDIPYDYLYDIGSINPEFASTDVVVVVGACDVVNPEAMTAEGTPIYGMPILQVHEARHIIVCNKDARPGYSGVENTLYNRPNVSLLFGNAAETLNDIVSLLRDADEAAEDMPNEGESFYEMFSGVRRVIIVPGYGMALAQAQWQVKALFDHLEGLGVDVRFAIHPVAGRMPGHMNVLLAEVDIPYDYLYDIDTINPEFAETDIVLVVGACDVVNPEAMTAERTPIYGMPILRAHEAHKVLVCNLDTRPGYSGVENSLYSRPNVTLLTGNAAQTLDRLLNNIKNPRLALEDQLHVHENTFYRLLHSARRVIIVPGYGMALAQAQWQVKSLFDHLEAQGVDVRFAIHPVAGRMPGHMNVLLAEVDIPYDYLYDIESINPEFASTDVVVVVGACDVVNPEAMTAEGTPIYGMPILRVHEARHIIVCNKDARPGYSGVENTLYNRANVSLLFGNAAETMSVLLRQVKV